MKKLILVLAWLATMGAVALPATADEETVNATVTAKSISVSVSPTSVAYGTLSIGTTDAVPSPSFVTVTNDGNVTENFLVRGANTTPGAWTLAGAAGANTYVHRFAFNGAGPYTALTTSNQTLFNSVVASGSIDLFLKMDLPTSSSTSLQQTAPVTVVATE